MICTATDTPAVDFTERHRPKWLNEVIGQEWVVGELREWLDNPYPTCMLFEGGTGVGKSTVAAAIAREIGVDVEAKEWGGFYRIPSGEQNADRVRDLIQATWTTPMGSPSGWKVLVVEEADSLSSNPAVERLWLSGLEELAPKTLVIFTTNYVAKMTDRVVQRFERVPFESRAAILAVSAQTLIDTIWLKETGTMDEVPKAETLIGLIDRDGNLSFRATAKSLVPLLRRFRAARDGRSLPPMPTTFVAPSPTAARNVNAGSPRSRPSPAAAPSSVPITAHADDLERTVANLADDLDRAGAEYNELDSEIEALKKQRARARRNGEPTAQLDVDLTRREVQLDLLGERVVATNDALKHARRELKAARKQVAKSTV